MRFTLTITIGARHPAAAPRRAFNDFQWELPTALPTWGPPEVLIGEVHSFGRIFSGCFYDTIRLIFQGMGNAGEGATAEAVGDARRHPG